ncbi:MAG: ComEC/Rec2 family competence protein [Patescibacteria group bacterium]|jgi:competence protein ComEC|nr:ComEC/Rec2 family competence protein [Patescibacteria group bacterium]
MIVKYRYLQRPHISWIIAISSIGVMLSSLFVFSQNYLWLSSNGVLIIALSLIFIIWRTNHGISILLSLVVGLCIGGYVTANYIITQQVYNDFYGKKVTIKGTVSDDTVKDPSGNYKLKVNQLTIQSTAVPGTIWASIDQKIIVKRGDVITLSGILQSGFGTMSGSLFRAQLLDIYRPNPGDIARKARDSFSDNVYKYVPAEQAQLGIAYVTGQKNTISEDLKANFMILGLIHLVVASGFHLTVIVGFSKRFFKNQSRYIAVIMSLLFIWLFLLLTGFNATMIRASLVAGISLLAWYYGRRVHPVVLLLFVAALTVIINPSFIWGDIGWYLSFAAFTGVIILAPLLNGYFWGDVNNVPAIRRIIITTVAAQITTFPIVAVVFSQYSPLALISNLLILPLVPLTMGLTTLTGLMAYFSSFVADIISIPTYWILKYMTSTANYLSVSPYAYGEIKISPTGIVLSYSMMIIIMIYMWRKTNCRFSEIDIV